MPAVAQTYDLDGVYKGVKIHYSSYSTEVKDLSGDIYDYLAEIDYADEVVWGIGEDSPAVLWHQRSAQDLSVFHNTVTLIYEAQYRKAAKLAKTIGFDLIRYTDTSQGEAYSGKVYYLLQDQMQMWDGEEVYPEGIFVFAPSAEYSLVVEVPHPQGDFRTALQGIGIFLEADVRALFLAGVHRRNFPLHSDCKNAVGSDYRQSDAAHNIEHTFQAAHVASEDKWGDELYYLQLHGFGSTSYQNIANQCYPNTNDVQPDDPNDPLDDVWLINISDTWKNTGNPQVDIPPQDSFVHTIAGVFDADQSVKTCVYNRDTFILGGTVNIQARYTNGVSNSRSDDLHVCSHSGGYGTTHSDRFIHVEQSSPLRKTQAGREKSIELYTQAIQTFFIGND